MEMNDTVAIRSASFAVDLFDKGNVTAESVRDAIATAIMDEKERCAILAEAHKGIKGKRIAALIRGTARGSR